LARSASEVLNDIKAIEAELEAIVGYEQDYPEYYDELIADRDRLIREYDEAQSRDEDAQMSLPGDSASINHPGYPEEHYDDDECSELPVSGEGDPICLIDWDEVEKQKKEEEARERDETLRLFGGVTHYGLASVAAHAYELALEQLDLRCPADAKGKRRGTLINHQTGQPHRGGGNFDVSKRIVADLRAVKAAIEERGGQLVSSGGFRPLRAQVNSARSATSFHYSGLAIDLFTLSATLDPVATLSAEERVRCGRDYVDQYVVELVDSEVDPYGWVVWCRSTTPTHPEVTMGSMKACAFDASGQFQHDVDVTGPYFNLTELFKTHGFTPIKGKAPWGSKSNASERRLLAFDHMEWWHFEKAGHLTRDKTKFGEVLLEIHTFDELKGTPPWQNRFCVFRGGSFK
jgi:hypothetical protein